MRQFRMMMLLVGTGMSGVQTAAPVQAQCTTPPMLFPHPSTPYRWHTPSAPPHSYTRPVLADVNGDGHSDSTVYIFGTPNLSVSLGNGDGTFQQEQWVTANPGHNPFDTFDLPSSLLGFDADNDNDTDFVLALQLDADSDNTAGCCFIRNNGNGTFQAPVQFGLTTLAPFGINMASAADLNGDGYLDVLMANRTTSAWVCYNQAGASFGAPVSIPVAVDKVDRVVAADLDSDGDKDLVIAARVGTSSRLLLFENQLPQPFLQRLTVSPGGQIIIALEADDVNGNNVPDIALARDPGAESVRVYLNGATPFSLQAVSAYPAFSVSSTPNGNTFRVSDLVVADVEGDGDDDMVAGVDDNGSVFSVSVLRNSGSGAFSPYESHDVNVTPNGVAVGQVDADTHPDIAIAGALQTGFLLGGSGGGRQPIPLGWFSPNTVHPLPSFFCVGDFDEDGDLDFVATIEEQSQAKALRNDGAGQFTVSDTLAMANLGRVPSLGDLDDDGHLDLVVVRESPSFGVEPAVVRVFWGNGDGTFDEPPLNIPGTAYMQGEEAALIVDVNEDGLNDIVQRAFVQQPDTTLTYGFCIWTNLGAHQFSAPVSQAFPGGGYKSLSLADMTGDGHIDAVGNADQKLWIMPGLGDGTFQAAVPYDYPGLSIFETYLPVVADLDGDGDRDVVAALMDGLTTNHLGFFWNNGGGVLSGPAFVQIRTGDAYAGFGRPIPIDIDGDGDLDLIVPGETGNAGCYVVRNQGRGQFTTPTEAYSFGGYLFNQLVAADFTGDGTPDVLTNGGMMMRSSGNWESQMYLSVNRSICPPPPCTGDINNDQLVNIDDLVQVITNWGPCPIGPPPSPLRPAALGGPGSGPGSGDMNCDFVTDVNDITPFMLALNDWKQYIEDYPDCDLFNGDMNNSGFPIDQADLAIFCPLAGGVISGQQCGIALPCPADITGNGTVDIDDLVQVITNWGACEI